jgi:hypothetical protein
VLSISGFWGGRRAELFFPCLRTSFFTFKIKSLTSTDRVGLPSSTTSFQACSRFTMYSTRGLSACNTRVTTIVLAWDALADQGSGCLLTHPSFDISSPDCGKLLLSESCFYIVSLLVSKRHELNKVLLVSEFLFSVPVRHTVVKARMNQIVVEDRGIYGRAFGAQKTTFTSGATTTRIEMHTSNIYALFL